MPYITIEFGCHAIQNHATMYIDLCHGGLGRDQLRLLYLCCTFVSISTLDVDIYIVNKATVFGCPDPAEGLPGTRVT
jgi:hypothetical protein